MFESTEYQDLIDKINKIRSYGLSKMLTIPQIAILGDQSSVNMRRSERVEMSAHIEGEAAFNAQYSAQDEAWDIHTIISEANRILCSSVQLEISEKVLEITISGPTLSPLTVIDLPGYINTTVDGQDKSIVKTIREINTRYIRDSRTIILAVVPANVDLNNIFVLGEAERYDQTNERTIPIVTKPDTIEQDLLPNLINTLLNRRKYMKLGYLVMKNSSYSDIDMPWDDARQREADFFKSSPLWNQVPDTRKGRNSVNKFLGELLFTHIKKELPLLKKEILSLIGECDKDISRVGPPVSDASKAKIKYIDCVMKFKSSLTALLDGHYSLEYLNLHTSDTANQDSELAVKDGSMDSENPENDDPLILDGDHRDKYMLPTDKISALVLRYKGNELPGFVSFSTFTQIYLETLAGWREMTKAHVSSMHLYLYGAITNFIAFAVEPLLKDTLVLEFDKFYGLQTAKVDDTMDSIFTDEETPFTLNKYYYDNILNSRKAKAEQQMQDLVNKFQPNTLGTTGATVPPIKLLESDINYNDQLAVEDLKEELQSYCKVARKRIVDVVLLQTLSAT
ncbi:hypothetical protein BGZ70_000072 [Mortierella alpina]|uniref:Dynamin GTPase domain-containing protein n=1 Tax=Mortierella alpina TaxID=64518 RepID=A0A9P6LZ37_MORAP|nr:hypothetical protein BGZ70_000072 [Mortierella alpina]